MQGDDNSYRHQHDDRQGREGKSPTTREAIHPEFSCPLAVHPDGGRVEHRDPHQVQADPRHCCAIVTRSAIGIGPLPFTTNKNVLGPLKLRLSETHRAPPRYIPRCWPAPGTCFWMPCSWEAQPQVGRSRGIQKRTVVGRPDQWCCETTLRALHMSALPAQRRRSPRVALGSLRAHAPVE